MGDATVAGGPEIVTFSLRGENFRAFPVIDANFDPPRWSVLHEDSEGNRKYWHGLGGWPQSPEAVQAAAEMHMNVVVDTGNCAGRVLVQLQPFAAIHRAWIDRPLTTCGIRIPGAINEFRIPGAIRDDDHTSATCGRCNAAH